MHLVNTHLPSGDFMQLKVIQTVEEFDSLADEWNNLLNQSASHVPFLRHEYLKTWWRTLGGGEWAQGKLYIVTARHPTGELCAIAPLFLTENRQSEPALMLLGSIEISDYLDIIARPGDLPGFIDCLLEHLSSLQTHTWQVIDWYNLLEDSPTLPALRAAASRRGWQMTQDRLQHCPYIPLPGDWETYLARIDKKQRHEIRRKMRRVETAEVPARWRIVSEADDLDAEIDAFLSLMGQDPEKKVFLTEAMRAQMHLAVHAAQRAGWLQLAFLEVDGEKAAGYLNFDYANRVWVYNSGINPEFSTYSPGWVLLSYLLQWANEHKRERFDFMRGNEDYKYRFGGKDRFVVRAKIVRK
jgi:CelD/BcsL family acetyltransferase involved in cellulose biosynthesis